MAFWSDINIEPKRDWRFKGVIENSGGGLEGVIQPETVLSFSPPKFDAQLSEEFNYFGGVKRTIIPNRYEWGPLSIVLRDSETNMEKIAKPRAATWNNSYAMWTWLVNTKIIKASTGKLNTPDSIDATWDCQVDRIGANGKKMEQWKWTGQISNITFGNFDYNSDALSTVKLDFKVTTVQYNSPAALASKKIPKNF